MPPSVKQQSYCEIAARYVRDTGNKEYDLREVVVWALENDCLSSDPADLVAFHRERMSEALRRHVTKDKKGRKIRLHHCIDVEEENEEGRHVQRTLWSHVEDATDDFMVASLQRRRDRMGEDAESLRADTDHYNNRRTEKKLQPIQLNLNFGVAG